VWPVRHCRFFRIVRWIQSSRKEGTLRDDAAEAVIANRVWALSPTLAPREALTQSPTLPRFVQVAHPRITDKRLCNALALRCRGIVIPASVPSRPGRSARVLSPLVGTLLGHIKAKR
jgi:hypothetical protein